MSDDAVKLARQVLERWELDPDDLLVVARAVIKQAEDIEQMRGRVVELGMYGALLRTALREALDEWDAFNGAGRWAVTARIAELRRLL